MALQVDRAQCVALASAPGFVLRSDAAQAWDRATAAFGKRVLLSGAWRSYATQEAIFRDRYRVGNHSGKSGFTTDVRTWNGQQWTRLSGTAAAAVPGTSNHGGGIAVDVKTSRSSGDPGHDTAVVFTGWNDNDRLNFLKAAKTHGWADDEGRRVNELWHLTYYPERDTHRGTPQTVTLTLDLVGAVVMDKIDLRNAEKSPVYGPRHVDQLQGLLNATQRYNLKIDNVGGAATKAAVLDWQAFRGIAKDAVVGADTWRTLLEF